jgi:hypothetical protein
LGIDAEGFMQSRDLKPLKPGAEASPFEDTAEGVVYKLFPLHVRGGLGKTLNIEWLEEDQRFESTVVDATLDSTLEKLMALHDAGALATEILGLAEEGDYLITKQPLARGYDDLEQDREAAVRSMKAVRCQARFNTAKWVFWLQDQAWAMSDLHPGNIMIASDIGPTIIDALASPLSPYLIAKSHTLRHAVAEARALRLGLEYVPPRDFDDVNDDEL